MPRDPARVTALRMRLDWARLQYSDAYVAYAEDEREVALADLMRLQNEVIRLHRELREAERD